ncbi:MAG: cofactor-independent phosphoglycerate mutase [Planctomycetota bacterium]
MMIVPDGAADEAIAELGGKTPLAAARTPNMDALAREGRVGTVLTVPEGMEPGSDVAILSILGYDPRACHTGRAPLEAASMGIKLRAGETAWRCNLVTASESALEDFSAGHISTEEARPLIGLLNRELASKTTRFHAGVGYRHLMVTSALGENVARTTPPHDIMGKPWKKHLPQGDGSAFLIDLMTRSREALAKAEVNRARLASGKPTANMIWLWGGGTSPQLESFRELHGVRGAVITGVDLVAGISALIGWDRIAVEGATAYLDTNYAGKGEAAVEALERYDFVLVHVEAPDEAAHQGSATEKVRAIEKIDQAIVKRVREEALRRKDTRILVLPDHPTPVRVRTHVRGPVPFVLWGPMGRQIEGDSPQRHRDIEKSDQPSAFSTQLKPQALSLKPAAAFSEREAERTGLRMRDGAELMGEFLRGREA